jgi:hypothetical protein
VPSLLAGLVVAGCAGTSSGPATSTAAHRVAATVTQQRRPSRPASPPHPRVLLSAREVRPTPFVPAATAGGQTAAWIARSASGVALLSFNQSVVRLALHSGTIDAGASGWHWGPEVSAPERGIVVAAFNGGFKLDTGAGGFMSNGRVAVPLQPGLGSIVTYTDGTTDIGAWRREVPAVGLRVASVRQNLSLLIDHGRGASNLDCVSCWGATLGGVSAPARSALGITADGRLIWAGGEHLSTADLAHALLAARVVRAVELDINPEWVAGYLYAHSGRNARPAPIPVVPGQPGVPGQFLAPYSRDFFTVQAR